MARITIHSYQTVIERIERDGHIFDLGQIVQGVIGQLFMAQNSGSIRVVEDSWPIRGCGRGSGEWRRVFELTRPEWRKQEDEHTKAATSSVCGR
jgi:hypothetical protein